MPATRAKKSEASKPNSETTTMTPAKTSKKRKMDADAQKYYAVRAGVTPGVYLTWAECQEQTAGFKGASYKSFLSRDDADAFVAGKKTSVDKKGEDKFYAVAVGRDPGIYTDWDAASLAIKGWKGPKYKKFSTREEAIEFIRTHGDAAAQDALQEEGVEPPSKKTRKSKSKAAAEAQHDSDVEHIYTDGSSRSNGRAGAAAGVGVFFGKGDPRNISERLQGELQTNQRAELTAILRALETVPVEQNIRIFSDSKYSISCATEWYRNWIKNNWKTKGTAKEGGVEADGNGEVKNKDLIMAIRAKIDERDDAGTKTLFQWVKGHAENVGNKAADVLAMQGSRRS